MAAAFQKKICATTHPAGDKLIDYMKLISTTPIDFMHFDIMDGKFVADQTVGAKEMQTAYEEVQNAPPAVVHLMVKNPQKQIKAFLKGKIKPVILTFQIEACKNAKQTLRCLQLIKNYNVLAGVALSPNTPLSVLTPEIQKEMQTVLLMSVVPGKSYQSFIEDTFDKIRQARKLLGAEMVIEVDGGINNKNIKALFQTGANMVALGSYLYKTLGTSAEITHFVNTFHI